MVGRRYRHKSTAGRNRRPTSRLYTLHGQFRACPTNANWRFVVRGGYPSRAPTRHAADFLQHHIIVATESFSAIAR